MHTGKYSQKAEVGMILMTPEIPRFNGKPLGLTLSHGQEHVEKKRNAASVSGNRDTLPKEETSRSKQQMSCEAGAFMSHLEALGVLCIVRAFLHMLCLLHAFMSHYHIKSLPREGGFYELQVIFRHCGVSTDNSSSRQF